MKKLVCFILSCMFVMAFTSQAYAIQNNNQKVEYVQQNLFAVNGNSEEVMYNVFVGSQQAYGSAVYLMARVYVKGGIITNVAPYIEIPRSTYNLRFVGQPASAVIADDGKSFTASVEGYVYVNTAPGEPVGPTGPRISISNTINLSSIAGINR